MSIPTRTPMRRCGRRWNTETAALASKAAQRPGAAVVPCQCGGFHVRPALTLVLPLPTRPRKPIRPVSDRRRRENQERRAMADRLWPDRRDGTVMCECGRPECQRRATDLHEPRFRSRLGSITDPENAIPVARECHDWIHTHEQEAQALGLAVHSWDTGGAA